MAYAVFLLLIISAKYRCYFLIGFVLPLIIFFLVAYFGSGETIFTLTNIGLFLLRGGLIASILSGSLVNFLVSKFRSL